MRLAGYQAALPIDNPTLLKINISWQHYYPACSTTPWQLEGVIKTLRADGYEKLIPAHNGTVVVDPKLGAVNNKHQVVERKYRLESVYLDYPPVKWVTFRPKAKMLVLDEIYPEGFQIPEMFIGKNIVHLPTVKTHVFTTITGAMKNAFGGLLNRKRHWTHSVIHETLVDLLNIQQEIHPGVFAVTDGTFAGDGPGPRAMRWQVKNVLLASADQVAIDALALGGQNLLQRGAIVRVLHPEANRRLHVGTHVGHATPSPLRDRAIPGVHRKTARPRGPQPGNSLLQQSVAQCVPGILFRALVPVLLWAGVHGTDLAQGSGQLASLSEKKLYGEAERALARGQKERAYEAFGLALPELAAATKIWRRMYESEEQLARDSLSFMKSEWAKRS